VQPNRVEIGGRAADPSRVLAEGEPTRPDRVVGSEGLPGQPLPDCLVRVQRLGILLAARTATHRPSSCTPKNVPKVTRHGVHQTGRSCQTQREESSSGGQAQAHDREPPEERPPRPGTTGLPKPAARREAGRKLEDRTREQLYELAKRRHVPGRSKMGQVGADRRLADGSLTRGVVGQRGLHLGCQPIGGEVLSQRETLGRVAQRESACFTRKRS
jgi:hypothetical protein